MPGEATHGGDGGGGEGDGGGGGEGDGGGGGGDGAGAAAGAPASQYVTTPPPRLSFHWSAPSIWRAAPHEPQLGTRLVPEPEIMVQLTPALQPPVQEAPKCSFEGPILNAIMSRYSALPPYCTYMSFMFVILNAIFPIEAAVEVSSPQPPPKL